MNLAESKTDSKKAEESIIKRVVPEESSQEENNVENNENTTTSDEESDSEYETEEVYEYESGILQIFGGLKIKIAPIEFVRPM